MRRSESPARLANFLPPGAEDQAEAHVHGGGGVGQVAGQGRHGEDQAQVEGLLGSDHVDERGGPAPFCPVPDARQVGGRVAVPPVGLAHDEGERVTLAIREALGEDALGTVVLDQKTLLRQLFDDNPEKRVVGALAGDVVVGEQDAQHGVDLVDVAQALGHEDLPEPQRLGVSSLEQDDAAGGSARRIRDRCRSGGAPGRRTR